MARYLIVAHQTAESEQLRAAARALARREADGEFVLLVPATRVNSLLVWEEGETDEIARRQARTLAQSEVKRSSNWGADPHSENGTSNITRVTWTAALGGAGFDPVASSV